MRQIIKPMSNIPAAASTANPRKTHAREFRSFFFAISGVALDDNVS